MPTLLVITTLLPLAGAVLLFLRPGWDYATARKVGLGTVLLTLALALVFAMSFRPGGSGYQFTGQGADGAYGVRWLAVGDGPGVRFALGLDGISLFLYVLTTLLMVTATFSSWESVKERAPAHYALLLMLEAGLLGLFASLDVIMFYVFFEFTLIPLFFLIGLYGGDERRRASVTFFLYTLAGSLLTLLGAIALVVVQQQYDPAHKLTFSIPELTRNLATLPWPGWSDASSWTSPQVLIFLLLFAGFAVKVPLFPFHTWLPLAHVQAPTAGSVLLAGVLLKVGGYGFLRFNLGMTPVGAQACFGLLSTLCVIGIIYGALTALAQTDVKKLVAYSSVSHMGFIGLGLFAMNGTGIDGAVMQMINHGITTGALFACVGVIYERYHTREMGEFGGLWSRMPLLAFFLILSALGSAAVPGLNGFVGEFPILAGMFARNRTVGILAAIGMILGAYYLMLMLQRVLFGPLHEPSGEDGHGLEHGHATESSAHHAAPDIRPVGWHEKAGLIPLMVLIVLIGVYPRPIFERIRPAARPIVTVLEQARQKMDSGLPAAPETTTAALTDQDRDR